MVVCIFLNGFESALKPLILISLSRSQDTLVNISQREQLTCEIYTCSVTTVYLAAHLNVR